jgi:hypothetical protein
MPQNLGQRLIVEETFRCLFPAGCRIAIRRVPLKPLLFSVFWRYSVIFGILLPLWMEIRRNTNNNFKTSFAFLTANEQFVQMSMTPNLEWRWKSLRFCFFTTWSAMSKGRQWKCINHVDIAANWINLLIDWRIFEWLLRRRTFPLICRDIRSLLNCYFRQFHIPSSKFCYYEEYGPEKCHMKSIEDW